VQANVPCTYWHMISPAMEHTTEATK